MRKISVASLAGLVTSASVAIAALHATAEQDRAKPGGPPDDSSGKSAPREPDGPGFGPGTFFARPLFAFADQDQDGKLTLEEAVRAVERFVRESDAETEGSINAEALATAINRHLGPPEGKGGAPNPGPGSGGPPGGFGPGMFLAPAILNAADSNNDGRLSTEEATAGVRKFFQEADSEKAGSIDRDSLAGALNRRMGPPPGFGGPGGPMGEKRKLVKQFDSDGDGRLNFDERRNAREFLKADREKYPRGQDRGPFGGRPPSFGGGFPPPGGPPGFGHEEEPVKPGPRVTPADVATYPGQGLYDPDILRTLFLEIEEPDWEAALTDFHNTDVEVPADLTVDGRTYRGVGLHFRGLSSYMGVREGHKRSLNLSLDFVHPSQRLEGYKTLNLLNAHEDPSFLHTVLFFHIARNYIPAPRANFVRVVVNGESWGLYVNAQQFDKILVEENFSNSRGKGARWKVRGNPGADGGLRYLGEDIAEYRKRFEIKSGDREPDWKALIALCKTLDQTPPDQLEKSLEPILDVEGALWFLALDNALINGDGYWIRASDYSIYRDPVGKFHVLPHDANETFGPAMSFGPPMGFGRQRSSRSGPGGPGAGPRPNAPFGPGGFGGNSPPRGPDGPNARPGSQGVDLDPLIGLDDDRKPLRSRLLAVPALRDRYLDHIRTIARDWLDWNRLGPVVDGYRKLIEPELKADTRKLSSFAAFQRAVSGERAPSTGADAAPGPRQSMSLRDFADRRRTYLLGYQQDRKVTP
jgi:Ca2+-binding EF-hand superfamily protein